MYESDDEQSKREFYYHESNLNNVEKQYWKWRFYITQGICYMLYVVRYMLLKKPYNNPLIYLDRLVITGRFQPRPTGSVHTVKISVWYFAVMTELFVL